MLQAPRKGIPLGNHVPTSSKCKHGSIITRIRIALTWTITETLGMESMYLFYEQILFHIHRETAHPLVAIRLHRHRLTQYRHRGRVIAYNGAPRPVCSRQADLYPLPKTQRTSLEVLEEMRSPPFEDLPPPVQLCANISTLRSGQNSVWP